MMRILYICISVSLLLSALSVGQLQAQETKKQIERIYSSPDSSNAILYRGAQGHGEGRYFFVDRDTTQILASYLRYGPMVRWLSDEIAEIKVPTGSPNYHAYYFDRLTKTLSSAHHLAISVDPTNRIVACYDDQAIVFYRLFTGEKIFTHRLDNLEPIWFLAFCRTEGKFLDDGTFHLRWQCPDEEEPGKRAPEQTITIRLESVNR